MINLYRVWNAHNPMASRDIEGCALNHFEAANNYAEWLHAIEPFYQISICVSRVESDRVNEPKKYSVIAHKDVKFAVTKESNQ